MEVPEFDKKKPLEEFFRDIQNAEFSLSQFLRTNEGNLATNFFKVSATRHGIREAKEYLASVMKGHLDAYASLILEKARKGNLHFQNVERYCLRGFEYIPGESQRPYHAETGFTLKDRIPIIYSMSGNWFSGNKIWEEGVSFSGSYRMDSNGNFFVYPRSRAFTEVKKNPWIDLVFEHDPEELKQQLLSWKEKTIIYSESKEQEVNEPCLLKELKMGIEKLLL